MLFYHFYASSKQKELAKTLLTKSSIASLPSETSSTKTKGATDEKGARGERGVQAIIAVTRKYTFDNLLN